MGICKDADFISLLKYIKTIIDLIEVAGALVLCITGMIAVGKAVVDKDADIGKATKSLGNKIIITCVIFLLPTIVEWVFFSSDFYLSNGEGNIDACIKELKS